jgi:YbbR domain-containing protein
MVKWIFNNFALKIGSVIIALFLWFHVVSERVVFETIESPIKFKNLPENLVIVNDYSEEMSYQIKTKVKQLILLNFFGHPFIDIDLSSVVLGKNSLELKKEWIVLPSWRPLEVIRVVSPREVTLETEERDSKRVQVVVPVKGTPREGNFLYTIFVEPDSLILFGGKKKLKKIREVVTDTIDITQKNSDYSTDVGLHIPPGGFSSEIKRVTVSIDFEKYDTKVLTGVMVVLKGDGNYEVMPESITVTVSGPKDLVQGVEPFDVKAYVDVKGIEEEVIPYFHLPEGIIFKSSIPQKVKVSPKE